MTIHYPPEFSDSARAAVDAERIRASQDFDKATPDRRFHVYASARTGGPLKGYIWRTFVAFSEEIFKLSRHGLWGTDRIQRECEKFFRWFAVEACREKIPGLDAYDIWGCSLLDWTQRELREGPDFHDYEDRLREVADARSKVGCPPAAQLGQPPEPRTAGSAPAVKQILESHSREKAQPAQIALAKTPAHLKAERLAKMTASKRRWVTPDLRFTWIRKAARVDHHDAYDWKNGILSGIVATRMDHVLDSPTPPPKPKNSGRSH